MRLKFSEAIRQIDTSKFERKNELMIDAELYCRENQLDRGWVNYVSLRLAFGDTVTVHALTDGVAAKVKNTVICNMPNEIPHFLTKPFILEARHDNALFDDIVSFAGYLSLGELFLITIFKDGGSMVQHEAGSFDGRKIGDLYYEYGSTYKSNNERTDTFSFVTVFALMVEADRTPIVIEEKRTRKANNGNWQNRYKSGWLEKRVFIDKKYLHQYKSKNHGKLNKEGKTLKDVYVHGFLRRQAYGPEHSLQKWIYIEGFDSTRWTMDGHAKVIVSNHEKA